MVSLNSITSLLLLLWVITFVFAVPCGDDGLYFQCVSEPGDIPVDIGNNGTLLVLGDDETSSRFNLSFPFRFYTTTYTSVLINSNGFLTFDDCCANCTYGGSACNVPLRMPNANLINTVIAPFWADLDPSAAGTLHTASDANNFRVQWTNVPQFSSSNNNTFQVHLTRNGDIWVYLRTLEVDPFNNRRIAIGLENHNGTIGFSVFYAVPGNHSRPATPSRLHFSRIRSTTTGEATSGTSSSITTTGVSSGTTAVSTSTNATSSSTTGKTNSSTTGKTNFSTTSIVVEVSSGEAAVFDILLFMSIFCGVCCVCGGLALFVYHRYHRQTRTVELRPVPTEDSSSSTGSSSSDDSSEHSDFEHMSLNDDDSDEPIVYADISAFDSLSSHAILKDKQH